MKTSVYFVTLLFFMASIAHAQTEKSSIRKGNREFNKKDYLNSEISYRKAVEKNPSSFKGNFNLSDALFKQEKYDETIKTLDGLSSSNITDQQKSSVYYNQGNTYIQQKKLKESVESYKNSLRLNPNDQEAKYNLAEAQRMLKQQQQQQQQNKDNKDNKDKKDNKDNKDKKDQDKKDDKDKDKNKDKQNQDQKNKDQQQPQQQKISQEDARRMLEALQNNEKQIQQKMREQKAKAARVQVEKNW